MTDTIIERYQGYDVLDKWSSPSWNEQTREVVARRLRHVPGRRFLTAFEWTTLEAICERVIPQTDRERPVPIVPWVDAALFENRTSGTRFAPLPPMREAWRRGLRAIDGEADRRFGRPFHQGTAGERDAILKAVDNEEVDNGLWQGLAPQRFFRDVLLREIVRVYYAHPAAWSQIGFGGPASPRGYARLAPDRRDPWEAIEQEPMAIHPVATSS